MSETHNTRNNERCCLILSYQSIEFFLVVLFLTLLLCPFRLIRLVLCVAPFIRFLLRTRSFLEHFQHLIKRTREGKSVFDAPVASCLSDVTVAVNPSPSFNLVRSEDCADILLFNGKKKMAKGPLRLFDTDEIPSGFNKYKNFVLTAYDEKITNSSRRIFLVLNKNFMTHKLLDQILLRRK